jgi:hypothetical protein
MLLLEEQWWILVLSPLVGRRRKSNDDSSLLLLPGRNKNSSHHYSAEQQYLSKFKGLIKFRVFQFQAATGTPTISDSHNVSFFEKWLLMLLLLHTNKEGNFSNQ